MMSAPYAPVAYQPEPGIDYCSGRPFMSWQKPALLTCIKEWLSLNPPKLELATLALEELKMRGPTRAAAAQRCFYHAGLLPIPWLAAARAVVLRELPVSTTPRGRGRLYVILRDGYTDRNGRYGAYVGVTSKNVQHRYVQHRTGVRSANGLPEHGIELLHSLFLWANPILGETAARQKHETHLHLLLEKAIPRVSGDVVDELTDSIV